MPRQWNEKLASVENLVNQKAKKLYAKIFRSKSSQRLQN